VVLGVVVVMVVVVDVEVVVGIVVISAPALPEQAPMRTKRTRSRDRILSQVKPDPVMPVGSGRCSGLSTVCVSPWYVSLSSPPSPG
jgi:hypothetical protein